MAVLHWTNCFLGNFTGISLVAYFIAMCYLYVIFLFKCLHAKKLISGQYYAVTPYFELSNVFFYKEMDMLRRQHTM